MLKNPRFVIIDPFQYSSVITKRRNVCGVGVTKFEEDCRKAAIASVCKPIKE